MDKRLCIDPWKVELVERYFSKESFQVSKMLKKGSPAPPAPVHSRPKIILDKRKFPIKEMVKDEKDQGKNCVSVVLNSSERIQVLKDLSSMYPVKYEGKNKARLDVCFHSPGDARLFFVKVNDLIRAGALRKIFSVIMFAEESLGRFSLILLLFSVFDTLSAG